MKDISIKDFQIGNDQDLTLMGGMNVLESEETALLIAEKFKEVTDKLEINWIFKASFDKANRSSIESFRGCLLYTSPSPRDSGKSRMPSSA